MRQGVPQAVCGYLGEMSWWEGWDGHLQDGVLVLQGTLTGERSHLQWFYTTPEERRWRETQTGEESVENTPICTRRSVSAEMERSPGATQIFGRCIYNQYLKHRLSCSYFAWMAERFLMWNYSTFTNQV